MVYIDIYIYIYEDREGKQRRGYDVGCQRENRDGATCERKSESKRFGPRDLATRDRTPGRAGHHRVNVGVIPHVEHPRRAGPRGNANYGKGREQRMEVAWRNGQPDGGREDRQNHHAWLHQRVEIWYARGQSGPCGELQPRIG
jgi:hypothetical protein